MYQESPRNKLLVTRQVSPLVRLDDNTHADGAWSLYKALVRFLVLFDLFLQNRHSQRQRMNPYDRGQLDYFKNLFLCRTLVEGVADMSPHSRRPKMRCCRVDSDENEFLCLLR